MYVCAMLPFNLLFSELDKSFFQIQMYARQHATGRAPCASDCDGMLRDAQRAAK